MNPSVGPLASNWYRNALGYFAVTLHSHRPLGFDKLFFLDHLRYIEALSRKRQLKSNNSDAAKWKLGPMQSEHETQAVAICKHFLREVVAFFVDLQTTVPITHPFHADIVDFRAYFEKLQN